MPKLQDKIKKLPQKPGIYFFIGARKEVLYIGKATSIRSRVMSYFPDDIVGKRSPLIYEMVEQTKSIDFRETD